jgi:Protein of unknown function (DUF2911)
MKIRVVFSAMLLLTCTIVPAQKAPPARGKTTIENLASIDYGRPSLKGRTIDDMFKQLPSDRVWRAGENQVTILTAYRNLLIGKTRIPAGKYSVYVHIGESGKWSLILNKNPGIDLVDIFPKAPPQMAHEKWAYYNDYTEKIANQEAARIPMKSEKLSAPTDLFTIELVPDKDGGVFKMSWGDRVASIHVAPAE